VRGWRHLRWGHGRLHELHPEPRDGGRVGARGLRLRRSLPGLPQGDGRSRGAISDVNINVYQAVDGEPGDLAESTRSLLEYETTRLEAGGTLDLQFNTHYALLNERSAALIDVFIFFTDDNFFTH
jgi:hypothetical protein